jgi:hypothetical protein
VQHFFPVSAGGFFPPKSGAKKQIKMRVFSNDGETKKVGLEREGRIEKGVLLDAIV